MTTARGGIDVPLQLRATQYVRVPQVSMNCQHAAPPGGKSLSAARYHKIVVDVGDPCRTAVYADLLMQAARMKENLALLVAAVILLDPVALIEDLHHKGLAPAGDYTLPVSVASIASLILASGP